MANRVAIHHSDGIHVLLKTRPDVVRCGEETRTSLPVQGLLRLILHSSHIRTFDEALREPQELVSQLFSFHLSTCQSLFPRPAFSESEEAIIIAELSLIFVHQHVCVGVSLLK